MDKIEYFPRKKLFEEAQDLVASFYSKGNYFSEDTSEYLTMLSHNGDKDNFFYCLYLFSMLSNIRGLVKVIEHIVDGLNSFRVKRKVSSIDEIIGEIDIETYVTRNYIEKVLPKEYPSIIKYSTFQMPEYQFTLFVVRQLDAIFFNVFKALGDNETITAFDIAHKYNDRIRKYGLLLSRRYGINYKSRETYMSLKKKVIYRYRNRKIQSNDFKFLIQLYEKMLQFNGIDLESTEVLEILDNYPEFDDRLYEIWLIRKSSEMLAKKMGITNSRVEYIPLFEARKKNKPAVVLHSDDYRIEILFQNRKSFMPKKDLKWFYWTDEGMQEEIGAIPDLIFIRYSNFNDNLEEIVLVDAKNRTWTFDHIEPIKNEIVQQIYIHDNFSSLFKEKYYSMLVAHNIQELQTRKYYHKDNNKYEINVISLNMKDEVNLNESMDKYIKDLQEYLAIY